MNPISNHQWTQDQGSQTRDPETNTRTPFQASATYDVSLALQIAHILKVSFAKMSGSLPDTVKNDFGKNFQRSSASLIVFLEASEGF